MKTNDVGMDSEEQEANVAQFQSIEDPTPSNLADETVSSRRSNATARERQWSERDQISVAPSNSPPTDPEANENEFEDEDINRFEIVHQQNLEHLDTFAECFHNMNIFTGVTSVIACRSWMLTKIGSTGLCPTQITTTITLESRLQRNTKKHLLR